MEYQIPEKIRDLVPYDPISGSYRVRLDANESYLNLSKAQIEKVFSRLETEVSYNRYPDPLAKKLCTAYAGYYGISPELVTAGNGSDELITLIYGTLFDPTMKVGTFAQDFSMYRVYAQCYGIPTVTLPKREDLTIDVDQTIQQVNSLGLSGLVFSNPCNPTGLGLTREEVLRLVQGVKALVILDEAYMDFWEQSLLQDVERFDNLLILKTCSKAIGLAGIRIGLAITNPKLSRLLKAVKSPYNVNSVSQIYGEELLRDHDYLHQAARSIRKQTVKLEAMLHRLAEQYPVLGKIYPSVTNFVYLKPQDSKAIYQGLQQQGIAIRLMGDYLRICAGSQEEQQILEQALETVLALL